jgi:hypothetical protein
MRRDLGLRQRNGVSVTASIGDQLGKLVVRDHAFVDRDVRDLVSGIDVDAGDVWILTEALFDAGDAGLASQRAGRDRQRCLTVAADMLRGRGPCGRTGTVADTVSIMRRAHGCVASERVISPSMTSQAPEVTVSTLLDDGSPSVTPPTRRRRISGSRLV